MHAVSRERSHNSTKQVMDLKSSSQPPTSSSSQSHCHQEVMRKGSLSKLNLKETSKKDGKGNAPATPVLRFSVGSSKWNDAEKWLISDQNQNHYLHGFVKSTDFVSQKSSNSNEHHQAKVAIHQHNLDSSFDVLKDKFTNEIEVDEPNILKFECKETSKSSRDIGTETSSCPTPFKTLSPPRHNTPATTSRPLKSLDCHLAKLAPFESNWSSREEEEEDISKSLTHFETNYSEHCRKSISEEEKTMWCLRYQREEAKIQAWVDLQNAKAEAQSRKLEVKIQNMRSNLEEKLMRKMAIVHKKAEELRVAAQLEHTQKIQKVNEEAKNQQIYRQVKGSCACLNLHT